jgi:hypothetical protein
MITGEKKLKPLVAPPLKFLRKRKKSKNRFNNLLRTITS